MQTTYIYMSIIVGLLQAYDGYSLYVERGRISALALTFSIFEYIWAAVSIYFIYQAWSLPISALWYPSLFVLYVAVMAVVGVVTYSSYDVTNDELPTVAPSAVISGMVFGLVFAICGMVQAIFLTSAS